MIRTDSSSSAFTLVEVTLAIGVAAFSLLAIFGLLPVGIATNQAALEQTGANNILSAVVSDLRSTPATVPRGQGTVSQQFGLAIPGNPGAPSSATVYLTSSGAASATLSEDSHYLVTVTFIKNGDQARAPSIAKVKVSWPAIAGPNSRGGSAEQVLVFDRN